MSKKHKTYYRQVSTANNQKTYYKTRKFLYSSTGMNRTRLTTEREKQHIFIRKNHEEKKIIPKYQPKNANKKQAHKLVFYKSNKYVRVRNRRENISDDGATSMSNNNNRMGRTTKKKN